MNTDPIICDCCGEEVERTDAYQIGDKWFCTNCEDDYAVCEECGDVFVKSDMQEVSSNFYCEECFDDNYTSCDYCGELINLHEDNYHNDPEGCPLCDGCFSDRCIECEDCGATAWRSDSEWPCDGNGPICRSCYENNYFYCGGCSEVYHVDQYGSDGYCQSCWDDRTPPSGVHDYGYKPSAVFHQLPEERVDLLFFGVELEVESPRYDANETAGEALEYSDGEELFYLKTDGSLNDGFEIVTHPCSLNYHLTRFPWDDLTERLKKSGCRSHDTTTCGLHVHVSRAGLSTVDQVKLAAFVHGNEAFCSAVARRNARQWAKHKAKEALQGKLLRTVDGREGDRYEAINFQNSRTVEFRIFRGTLKADTIKASLEWITALIHFLRTVPVPRVVQEPEAVRREFCTYVRIEKKYPFLAAYFLARGICKEFEHTSAPQMRDYAAGYTEQTWPTA